jgi:putative flippase GtrA
MTQSTRVQAVKFVIVGGVGFVVDAGILTLLNSFYGFSLLQSRICSVSIALTVTWFLNRQQTFSDQRSRRAIREWGRYAAVNSFGAILNMGIFFWLIHRFDSFRELPLLPLTIAASIALIFNFFASKHIAFRREQA